MDVIAAISEARTLTRGLRGYCTKNDSDHDATVGEEYDEILDEKRELKAQGVDPRKGWNFRGVHKVLT